MANSELITRYLPPLKADFMERCHQSLEKRSMRNSDGSLKAMILTDATLTPLGCVPGVSESTDPSIIIDDCDFCTGISGSDRDIIDETVVYCGYLFSKWGHFLCNTPQRLWYTLLADNYDGLLFFMSDDSGGTLTGNYREFFELLGITDKIRIHRRAATYSKIIVPAPGAFFNEYYSDEFMTLINRVKESALRKFDYSDIRCEPIFLTRSSLSTSSRNEPGIEMLDNLLAANGYNVINPEKISLSQLIALMANAPRIASIAGSTAHNMLFANPGQECYVFERSPFINYGQPLITKATGCHTTYIEASLAPATVAYGLGPFLYYPTRWLTDFAHDQNMKFDFEPYSSPGVVKRNLRRFFKTREYLYGRKQVFEPWLDPQARLYAEAARHTTRVLEGYLKPSLIKRIIGKYL